MFILERLVVLGYLVSWVSGPKEKNPRKTTFDKDLGPVYTGPGKFLHRQKPDRTGRIFERLSVQVWDLFFRGPKLVDLALQKFVHFRRSRVNERWNRASFCACKNLSGPE